MGSGGESHEDRGHGAVPTGAARLHLDAALAHQADPVREIEAARGDHRGVLAHRVPGEECRVRGALAPETRACTGPETTTNKTSNMRDNSHTD